MNDMLTSIAATQKQSLDAAHDFANGYLASIERLTQIHIDITRNHCEKSAEIVLLYLDSAWSEALRRAEA